MFSQRWSTITLISVFTLAAVLGFYSGKFSVGVRIQVANTKDFKSGDSSSMSQSMDNMVLKTDQPSPQLEQMEITEDTYRHLLASPATPARDDELIVALGKLAEQNPLRAIELARSEINQRLRMQLVSAAFLGWGKADAKAAADWILAQSENDFDHNAAIAAVLKGAIQNPLRYQYCPKFPLMPDLLNPASRIGL